METEIICLKCNIHFKSLQCLHKHFRVVHELCTCHRNIYVKYMDTDENGIMKFKTKWIALREYLPIEKGKCKCSKIYEYKCPHCAFETKHGTH